MVLAPIHVYLGLSDRVVVTQALQEVSYVWITYVQVPGTQATSGCVIMQTGCGPVGISYRAELPSKKNILLPSIRTRPHKYVRGISK